jgi:hypothetical protein
VRGPQASFKPSSLVVRYIVVRLFVPHCTNNDSARVVVASTSYRYREILGLTRGTDCAFDVRRAVRSSLPPSNVNAPPPPCNLSGIPPLRLLGL